MLAPDRPALEIELERLVEAGEGVALAMLDVDNLSEVNASHGHVAGDRALATLATVLGDTATWPLYRVAGDEFAFVLPGVSLEQAFLQMEALRQVVAGAGAAFDLPDGRGLTVGIGVAHAPRDARTARALFSAADAALGAAKENGGNQVALPPNEEMVMKSCYYSGSSLRRLKALAERLGVKESPLLREALDDILRKYKSDTGRDGV
jgi:diguanylate cyclase (GGDEF)-like protein